MENLKQDHPNFQGNWEDLRQFLKLAHSPIRSPEREQALEDWSAYKKKRQVEELQKTVKSERVLTKGGYISSLSMQVIDLRGASLDDLIIGYADMRGVILDNASMRGAWMKGVSFQDASLKGVDFQPIGGRNSRMMEASFNYCDLTGAKLQSADLSDSTFKETLLVGTDLSHANLSNSVFTSSNLQNATLSNSRVFGVAAWNLNKEGTVQKNLLIEPANDVISVDDLEIAQFVYMLLNNNNITNAISTIGKKGVLILGRFTPERKIILDSIREELRNNYNLLPIVFDFDRATEKDVTETIKILAGLSRFVIADISEPKSSPLELQATVPNYMVPFVTIIQQGERPFSMFVDLWKKYEKWVLKPLEYASLEELLANFRKGIINRALRKEKELLEYKVIERVETIKISDLPDDEDLVL
ncbi:MAG: pentapeptide repeat-containing protein [Calditrichia bacterium]